MRTSKVNKNSRIIENTSNFRLFFVKIKFGGGFNFFGLFLVIFSAL